MVRLMAGIVAGLALLLASGAMLDGLRSAAERQSTERALTRAEQSRHATVDAQGWDRQAQLDRFLSGRGWLDSSGSSAGPSAPGE